VNKTQALYRKAKKIIPGGTQLLSKRPEIFLPDRWPAYFKKAKRCEVWDLDGKKYVDMSYMGIGACLLGYGDPDVNSSVENVIRDGSMSTLNPPEEVELAQLMLDLHPWADMARFARTGGEAMAVAVRIARASSGRDIVLFCGYHGWHDWYLSANLSSNKALDGQLLPGLSPKGVPRNLKGTTFTFRYNDVESLNKLLHKHNYRIAAIVMESVRNDFPNTEFLDEIRRGARKYSFPIVVDEVSAGFRLCPGGAHLVFNFEPDIAVFAKGISNGYPMSVVIGKRKYMEVAQDTFISSTYWTERIGPAAAVATIKKYIRCDVHKHLNALGKMVQDGWSTAARTAGLSADVGGIYPLGHFSFKCNEPLVAKTLFTQEMLKKHYLATTAFYPSYGHKKRDIERYLMAVRDVFSVIAKALKCGNAAQLLKGPVCHTGFKRLT